MLRGGNPILDDPLEFLRRHAGVGGHDDLGDGLFSTGQRAFHVAFEHRGKRLLVLPFRMVRGKRLHAVERKD